MEKVNFFFENLRLVPETSAPKEHFKLLFGSGNSDLAKIRPLKVWTSWISPWVPPYGILPRLPFSYRREWGGFQKEWILLEKGFFCIIKQGKKTREVTSPGPRPLIYSLEIWFFPLPS